MNVPLTFLTLTFLAVVSVGLACVEAAFYLMRRRRVSDELSRDPRGELVHQYRHDPPALLMPIHMGTYTAHLGMALAITSLFMDFFGGWALLLAFVAMLVHLLVFRLTLPYALVRRDPEGALLRMMPFADAYARLLGPLVLLLRRRATLEPPPEAEDLSFSVVPELPPPPVLEQDEGRLVDSVARFATTQVRDVMTPRPDIVAVAGSASLLELRQVMRETKYSRIPVFGDNLDDVVGVVTVRDMVEYDGDLQAEVKTLARPAFLVPESKKIADLLREFQQRRVTFALVIDEYGGTAGLVSAEDIVEEIVGEIKDEYDVETEPIVVDPDGSLLVAGRVAVDRLEQAVEMELNDSDEIGTVGGLVTTVFGRIPKTGEKVQFKGFEVEIVDAERKRVNRIRMRRLAPSEAGAA